MAITFQYNKTSLQALEKNLKMRQRTLPTLQNKESALRLEVKKAKKEIEELDVEVNRRIKDYDQMLALWGEFDTSLIHVDDVRMSVKKIAGVRVPVLEEVVYSTKEFSLFSSPKWFADGFEQLKAIADVGIRQEFVRRKVDLLDYARKKTTQKVNLFEKVQIPGYQDAITREQFAELVVQVVTVICGAPETAPADTFTDTKNPAILKADQAGIVDGVGNSKFAPTQTTNREQIATMIARAIAYIKAETGVDPAPPAGDLSKYTDKTRVSGWAVDGVGLLASNGIMKGTSDTTLSPKASCTVEQSILFVFRMYQAYQKAA